ncbi:MAG: lysophospholipid acyltransferase family protein [Cytophagales bacterium]|nr:1-acyl-sn-glycerol-3-phosphate acyltransferase [Bernardetiaceae bacterium]MDW8210040.1 lysophospholipid acyltransferase family protein [Cytophagales bacterium]
MVLRIPNLQKVKLPRIGLFSRDPFGNWLIVKRALMSIFALTTYPRFNIINKLKIEGTEYLMDLPDCNVLFISNHQTYYADVIAMYHIFCSVKWRMKNTIRFPIYFLMPRARNFYVAAEETMLESGFLPRLFSYTGAITVRRSWRSKGQDIQRPPDRRAPEKIKKALGYGWVINFPQGTTKPYAPVRKGTAHIIRDFKPIVVPVVLDGFRRAFDKKGLKIKKRGVTLSVRFKPPIVFDDSYTIEEIKEEIARLIEQVPEGTDIPPLVED